MHKASGKVILLGEHAVVYGEPALAAALDRGCRVHIEAHPEGPFLMLAGKRFAVGDDNPVAHAFRITLEVTELADARVAVHADFDLPIGAGLGSSAAFAVALVRALYAHGKRTLTDPALDAAAHEVERLFHGTPSGLDAYLARTGELGLFVRGEGLTPVVGPPFKLVIAASGVKRSTEKQVSRVADRHARVGACAHVMKAIGEIARQGARAVEMGDLHALGELMDMNQSLLAALGVSHPALESLIAYAKAEGALGAKLTGAGGGGCVVVLAPGNEARLAKALEPMAREVIVATIGGER
jgi:mevalonate kinase